MRLLKKIYRFSTRVFLKAWQWARIGQYKLLSDNWPTGAMILQQPLLCTGRGVVTFKGTVAIGVFPSPAFTTTYAHIEARNSTASITIGAGTQINNNLCIIAEHTTITIGDDCLLGTNVEIIDSDFHGLAPDQRQTSRHEWARPVRIGNNVFIASHSKIMKGVVIGDDTVIAAGSIVTRDIPAGSIAGGNPARVLKTFSRHA